MSDSCGTVYTLIKTCIRLTVCICHDMCVGFTVDKVCCKDYSVSCFNTELLNSYTCYVNADDAVPHCAHVDPEILMPF